MNFRTEREVGLAAIRPDFPPPGWEAVTGTVAARVGPSRTLLRGDDTRLSERNGDLPPFRPTLSRTIPDHAGRRCAAMAAALA